EIALLPHYAPAVGKCVHHRPPRVSVAILRRTLPDQPRLLPGLVDINQEGPCPEPVAVEITHEANAGFSPLNAASAESATTTAAETSRRVALFQFDQLLGLVLERRVQHQQMVAKRSLGPGITAVQRLSPDQCGRLLCRPLVITW